MDEKTTAVYMKKTIREVRKVLRMDRQEAARKYGKGAQEVDRFLMDKAIALLDGMAFFLGMDDETEETEEEK